ncbi:hypothetical protein PV458_27015 [Streptomyces sp. MN03-5084-2B]|nr:hypothetical protein [Streptomyces sp. MN03-5084-2B]
MKVKDWPFGAVFPLDEVGDGRAQFTEEWVKKNGEPPPASLVIRRQDGTGETLVLRAGPDRPDADGMIAISNTLFTKIAKTGEMISVPVRFRPAGFWRRAWYRQETQWEILVALLATVATVATGVVTLITGLVRQATPGAPSWLLIGVFVVVCVAALAKLRHDVRKADRANA